MSSNRSRRTGMTLIEVVMALAVLSILLVVAFGSLSSISRSKQTLDDYQDVYLVAQSLLRRLTRELQLISCDKDNAETNCSRGRGILPPPDKPNENTGSVLVSESNENNKETNITFLAMEAGQYILDGSTRSGLVQLSYRLGKENTDDALFTLVRDEVPYLHPAAEAYKKRITFPLTRNVVSMAFQFYDSNSDSWTQDWGIKTGTLNSLPSLIKFRLVLRSKNGIDLPFETIVAIRTALLH